jgi:hypothetical protein
MFKSIQNPRNVVLLKIRTLTFFVDYEREPSYEDNGENEK